MLVSGRAAFLFASVTLSAVLALGCTDRVDVDSAARPEWVRAIGEDAGVGLRAVLNGTEYVRYFNGWYPLEFDPQTHGAWRWMGKKGIVRLRTKPDNYERAIDMEVEVFGWVPVDPTGIRTFHLEFAINGHVLGRLEPDSPNGTVKQTFVIPHALLDHAEWVDFVITVANANRAGGDVRDLGFATTGVLWHPAGPR